MERPNIEIREVRALRVDAAGRIGRLRVIGVADRANERLTVEACVGRIGGPRGPGWRDQDADAYARIVDPTRTFVGHYNPQFVHDIFTGERGPTHLWVAEIDLLSSPAVPPIVIGRQRVPVNIRARYVFADTPQALRPFLEVEPIEEFDVGVLFVHGIGRQRRAETLAQWSTPLLRWINAWLDGATDEIARKLPGALVEGTDATATSDLHVLLEAWLNRLAVHEHMGEVDVDFAEREGHAEALVRKALKPTFKSWREELAESIRRFTAAGKYRRLTPEERSAADKVTAAIYGIEASAVGGSADFRDAYILDVGPHSVDPSSVEVHLQAMAPDGYMLRSRWMFAESHWGETFRVPSFFRFGRWCLLTAPILLVHYIAMARLRHPRWLRWIAAVFGLAVAVTLAQLGFLLLTTLWVLPWQRIRSGVLRVQLALAGVVGDSYVLLEDPVQRRAILDRVHRNIEWLVQRCRRVVVIAHSQGAALAELALSQREDVGTSKVHSLATLGAGVQTLRAIGILAENHRARTAGWGAIACVLLLGCALAVAMMRDGPAGLVLAVLASAGLVFAAAGAWNAHPGRPSVLPRAAFLRPWHDFFARRDLVPYGPLIGAETNRGTYKPKEVRNRDSYAADHVTYWQNTEQVVGPLARLIGAAAGFKPLSELLPDDDATLARLERSRGSRLRFLRAGRSVALLATSMLLYTTSAAWMAFGSWAVVWMQAKLGSANDVVRAPAHAIWLQMLVVFAPFVIQRSLVNAIFEAWTTVEVERLLRRSSGRPATAWAATFTTVLAIVLGGTVAYIWPINFPAVALVTAILAIVSGWIAGRAHVQHTDVPASPGVPAGDTASA